MMIKCKVKRRNSVNKWYDLIEDNQTGLIKVFTFECCPEVGGMGTISSVSRLPEFGSRCSCTEASLWKEARNVSIVNTLSASMFNSILSAI